MFHALVFSMCAGVSAPVGTPCDEYMLDSFKTLKECTVAQDKRIKAGNILFKGNSDWVLSCERSVIVNK